MCLFFPLSGLVVRASASYSIDLKSIPLLSSDQTA